jgi:hypothetical protein
MKKIPALLILIGTMTFFACNNEPEADAESRQADDTDSLEVERVDTLLSGETISFFNQSGFSDFAKSKAPGFDWSKFRIASSWQDDSLLVSDFTAPDNYEVYKRLFRYSPDSSMYLDLDSYNVLIQKDKRGNYVADDSCPDTEVSLVNTRTNKKTRLIYTGPGNTVEDGAWIDSDNLVIMGFQEADSTEDRIPVLWRFNISSNTFYQYEMPDAQVAKQLMGEWRKERLSKINTVKKGF